MYRPVLVTAPATTPVSLAEAKAHCRRTEDNGDDTKLSALIAAATSYLDGWTGILGRCLCEQSWQQDYDCFSRSLRLPLMPVSEIESVTYTDPNGDEQTVASSDYDLLTDDLGAYVRFKFAYVLPQIDFRDPPSVRVVYTAGYEDAASIPSAIKQAMLLLIEHWFDNRSAVVVADRLAALPLPIAVDALLAPYRRIRF